MLQCITPKKLLIGARNTIHDVAESVRSSRHKEAFQETLKPTYFKWWKTLWTFSVSTPVFLSGMIYKLLSLAPALWPCIAAFNPLRLWSLDMVSRYPLLIIALSTCRNGRPIGPQCSPRFSGVNFLGATCLLRSIATPGALLWEVGSDPDGVEEIEDTSNAG